MKTINPGTGKITYFIDKCRPFGASISCAPFQRFLNALKHIIEYEIEVEIQGCVTNYIDNFCVHYTIQRGLQCTGTKILRDQ